MMQRRWCSYETPPFWVFFICVRLSLYNPAEASNNQKQISRINLPFLLLLFSLCFFWIVWLQIHSIVIFFFLGRGVQLSSHTRGE
jgi:hypothetical protein